MIHKIVFKPHNREIEVAYGSSLIRAAMESGVHINASCGGEGVCGKCRVLIEQGEIEEAEAIMAESKPTVEKSKEEVVKNDK